MKQHPILHSPRLRGSDPEQKRAEIKEYFNQVYTRYESLFELLACEDAYYTKAIPLRHPLIFYFGHTATFFINKLKFAKVISQRVDPRLESIFAIGVDEMSWDDLDEAHYGWPTVEQTKMYRKSVQTIVNELIDRLPLALPIAQDSPWWVILMGIEHENIHLETSSVLIRQLPLERVQSNESWKPYGSPGDAPQNELLSLPGGSVILGKRKESELYGWDNEYGSHMRDIPPFAASKYLVSNGEYLAFIEENGYKEARYWDDEGDAWRLFAKAEYPSFWLLRDDVYLLRTLTAEIPLPLNWPVEVNCHEANAFCRWLSEKKSKTITLPTEDEYVRLRDYCGVSQKMERQDPIEANINLSLYASSVPIDSFAHGDFYDVIGNVWQWSQTPIYPFEGFEVHPIYDDFTVPTFDGKHNLIKGGSWISCGNLATPQSRYAFRRHFFQHAGFRYIQSDYQEEAALSGYESDRLISQYCHFGWGESHLDVPNYPEKCAKLALDYMDGKSKGRALDIGCAIGRSSFELARGFEHVVGVDFSARFIQNAEQLRSKGHLRYRLTDEGDLDAYREVSLADFDLNTLAEKVEFWQGDACNLKPNLKGFDLIFAGNLIDRLYDPRRFLLSLYDRLNPGGLVILTSPYTWQEESTPKERWIGGFKRDGENFTTLDGLREILEPQFALLDTKDIPFVIRETARKFQHSIAQMSVWERIG